MIADLLISLNFKWGCRDRMVIGFTKLFMQPVPITTKVASSNPAHGEVYSIQHYVIKCISDLRPIL